MLDASLQVHQNIGSWRFMAMKHKRILDSQEGKAGQSCAHFQLMEKKQTYRKREKKGIERERDGLDLIHICTGRRKQTVSL